MHRPRVDHAPLAPIRDPGGAFLTVPHCPPLSVPGPASFHAQGAFTAEIFMDRMPITASNFIDLANTGFYNGVHFHRVIDGCVRSPPFDVTAVSSPIASTRLPSSPRRLFPGAVPIPRN